MATEHYISGERQEWSRGKSLLILTLGMAIAAIPGFLLAPYGINFFDEPYQILNSWDWRSSVYSPLSAWIGHYYGISVQWKYLAFRYLACSFAWLSVFITAVYATLRSHERRIVIPVSIISTYFILTYKIFYVIYGWDSWTILFLTVNALLLLEIIRKLSPLKILVLSLLTAFLTLLRIPNISVLIPNSLVLFLLYFRKPEFPTKAIRVTLIYVITSLLFVAAILCIMYGSLKEYFNYFATYKIGAHSFSIIAEQYFKSSARVFLTVLLLFVFYVIFRKIYSKTNHVITKLLFYLICICVFLCILWPHQPNEYGHVDYISLALLYLSLIFILIKSLKERNRRTVIAVIMIAVISPISTMGSNLGITKGIVWPLVPIVAFLGARYLNKNMLTYAILWIATLFVYSFIALNHKSFFNHPLKEVTFRFPSGSGVMEGMWTYPEDGEKILFISREMRKYEEAGYEIIPLKAGNQYMWEYQIPQANMFQRHTFDNWFAFWDKNYVNAIKDKITHSKKPVVIMFMQWKDPDDMTPMMLMLEENTECVLDRPGYSFWVKK